MKLPFFNTKSRITKQAETNSNKLQADILRELEQEVPLLSGSIIIKYVFVCENGRDGDHFAAKLAEEGDIVNYSSILGKGYQITGTTVKFNTNEQLLRNRLFAMMEKGTEFNCSLTEWQFEAAE